ncbi:MAG TPA: J domain-containing protein, partial [Stenomitos sp.]
MTSLEHHYRVLDLQPGASLTDINQAYKDLVFIWHPDRIPQENERLYQKAIQKLQEINAAREALRSHYRNHPNGTSSTSSTTSNSAARPSAAARPGNA